MLARAACRILSIFCAVLYLVIGVHGTKGEQAGSARKQITSTLLKAVANGYPKPILTTVGVSGGGRISCTVGAGSPYKIPRNR